VQSAPQVKTCKTGARPHTALQRFYMDERTIFQKIADGSIPAKIIYRDELCIAINDINPQAPRHILVIPIKPIKRLSEAQAGDAEILSHLMLTAAKVAKSEGLDDGFRLVVNNGLIAGETVPHMHLHILGGRIFHWPPG